MLHRSCRVLGSSLEDASTVRNKQNKTKKWGESGGVFSCLATVHRCFYTRTRTMRSLNRSSNNVEPRSNVSTYQYTIGCTTAATQLYMNSKHDSSSVDETMGIELFQPISRLKLLPAYQHTTVSPDRSTWAGLMLD
jgi:hypothetical protein